MNRFGKLSIAVLALLSVTATSTLSSFDKREGKTTIPAVRKMASTLPTVINYSDEPAFMIHYHREDGNYDSWALWLWLDGGAGQEYDFNYQDDDGAIAYYPLSAFVNTAKINFIVKSKGSWDSKDVGADRSFSMDDYPADEHQVHNIYLLSGDKTIYGDNSYTGISDCGFVGMREIQISATRPITACTLIKDGEPCDATVTGLETKSLTLTLKEDASISSHYVADITFNNGAKKSQTVSVFSLYGEDFDREFAYDGELGAIYTKAKTTFRVWSPISTKIILKIYDNGTPKALDEAKGSDTVSQTIELAKSTEHPGIFEAEVKGDLEGKYYTYTVTNTYYPAGKEIVDPYAKSTGLNGQRGMIVDFAKTNPEGWKEVNYLPYDRKHITTYETHVADVTSSETWTGTEKNRKRFLGLQEKGTLYTDDAGRTVRTGFDHIRELGVNAVQLIPIFDQDNDEREGHLEFNWGYNPLNYNSLEGAYSSDPYDGYAKIREFKQVVKAYHDAGIEIIMDVVYNHVMGAAGSNFDVLMPGYYFRYDNSGALYNGSGCGNETASERAMFRKFMIDSTGFWMKEYKLGGFRFDLMGLHDLTTMNQLVANLKTINPYAVVYGEPWTGGDSGLDSSLSAKQDNVSQYVGFGQFNDQMRDALIKGGMKSTAEIGWSVMSGDAAYNGNDIAEVLRGMKGATGFKTNDPDKTVNYVTCHDNYTLRDRFVEASAKDDIGIGQDKFLEEMNCLSNSVVFLSQGTTFMLSGEEMLRTKGGSGNSYNLSYEVNELDYSLKAKHMDLFENYQKLIHLKQTATGLAMTEEEIAKADSTFRVEAVADRKDSQGKYEIHNNIIHESFVDESTGVKKQYEVYIANDTLKVPFEIDTTGYTLYLDTLGKNLGKGKHDLEGMETLVMVK